MSKKNLAIIDTNVIIRFLIGDHKKLFERAAAIFKDLENEQVAALLPESVFAEVVFVLEKNYRVERDKIADLLGKILDLKGIKNKKKSSLKRALYIYRSMKIDIVDCLIAAHSVYSKSTVLSFDRDIEKAVKFLEGHDEEKS